jgi:hypothetical protein
MKKLSEIIQYVKKVKIGLKVLSVPTAMSPEDRWGKITGRRYIFSKDIDKMREKVTNYDFDGLK